MSLRDEGYLPYHYMSCGSGFLSVIKFAANSEPEITSHMAAAEMIQRWKQ